MRSLRYGWAKSLYRTMLAAGVALVSPCLSQAQDLQRAAWINVTEENNNLGADSDHYYVNGFSASWLTPSLDESADSIPTRIMNRTMEALTGLPGNDGNADRRIEWTVLGQQIFTPADKTRSVPDPHDRPYAGWLYTGVDLLQNRDGNGLDDLSATVGLVGPDALGRQVQNGVHKLFGFGSANGWSYQLHDEPALTFGYARKWRWSTTTVVDGLQLDMVPEVGATVGNLIVQAQSTVLVRAGWGLDSSYGPHLLWPGMQGDGYFAAERASRGWALNVFAGLQGRAVAHNLLLDGNTGEDGPSVSRYPWVHEYIAGLSGYFWQRVRMDLTYVHESEEFRGQQGAESYGSATVSVRW